MFIDSVLSWASITANHFAYMFWWMWLLAIAATALSESFLTARSRRRLLERPADGWPTVWRAALLGILSPPSRGRIFRQARELLARGVSPVGVITYLVTAQSILLWMLLAIVALDGPQPMIGLFVAVGTALAFLAYGLGRTPVHLWERARAAAERDYTEAEATKRRPPIVAPGPLWARPALSVAGQAYSLWWPLLFGLLGVGFFLALGQSQAYLSLQGSKGPLVQLGNAGVGLLLAYVTGAPLVGNSFFAAGLWKAEFVTYAGLSAFYLGTLVMPFVLPRYFELLGIELAKKVLWWLIAAILVGSLAAAAWWWGLDWLAGTLHLRGAFEAFTHSTMRPNDVPWFHHWFQSAGMPGMSGM